MITLSDIEAARDRIKPYLRRTPVMQLSQMREPLPTGPVVVKQEHQQITGSFKARGAMNRYLGAPVEEVRNGIVTASGGNHGLAVARTAFAAGVPAGIFVPSTVSADKVQRMRGWGADVRIVGDDWLQSNEAALAFAKDHDMAYFHPFADPLVVAGQGTLGLELVEDIKDLDTVVIAIGGGGLISGVSTALRAHLSDVRIIGVEPTGSPTLKASLEAGEVVSLPEITSRVPTMSCGRTEPENFEIVRNMVDEIVLVSDEAMLDASKWLWAEFGIAADLAGSASIAAIRSGAVLARGEGDICALVCGSGREGVEA